MTSKLTKSVLVGVLGAGLIAASATASAARVGLDIGVGIPITPEPAYVAPAPVYGVPAPPVYADPYYYGPSVGLYVGPGWGGGGHDHGHWHDHYRR